MAVTISLSGNLSKSVPNAVQMALLKQMLCDCLVWTEAMPQLKRLVTSMSM